MDLLKMLVDAKSEALAKVMRVFLVELHSQGFFVSDVVWSLCYFTKDEQAKKLLEDAALKLMDGNQSIPDLDDRTDLEI